jgi:hypothetical protein
MVRLHKHHRWGISVGRSLLLLLRAEQPFEGWNVKQRKEFQSEFEVFPSSSLLEGFYYEGKQLELGVIVGLPTSLAECREII